MLLFFNRLDADIFLLIGEMYLVIKHYLVLPLAATAIVEFLC